MSVELRPYNELDTDELAADLHEIVGSNRDLLASRRLLGVISRYACSDDRKVSIENAKAKVAKGQRETEAGTLMHYALVDASGEVSGQASIFPDLQLIRSRVPLHPRVLPSVLKKDYPHANPNISAWTVRDKPELLSEAYRTLRDMTLEPIPYSGIRDIPWTIEPNSAPSFVHDAIMSSGLERVTPGRYYEGEGGMVVPRSTLYAATSEWFTSRGRHQELATGDWHGSFDEIESRNPR